MKANLLRSLLGFALVDVILMGNGSTKGTNDGSYGHGVPENKPTVIPAGCKEYSFYGHTVVAISEKSARKKCKRLFDLENSNRSI